MKQSLFLIIATALFFGCTTTDRVVVSLDEKTKLEVKDIEISLLDYSFNHDKKILEKTEPRVRELIAGNVPNKRYLALLQGLLGEILFYKNDIQGTKRAITAIGAASTAEQRLYILKAKTEPDNNEKLSILLEGLMVADPAGLISLELAILFFKQGRFRDAFIRYDEAFLVLSPRYREHFQKDRDLAFKLKDSSQIKIETMKIIEKPEITIGDAISLINQETTWFSAITNNRSLAAEALFVLLKEKNYLVDQGQTVKSMMKRGEMAILFLSIIAWLENNPKLLVKYAPKAGRPEDSKTLVADLKVTDPWYTASLILVEREILELPDGTHFYPNMTIKGSDFFEIIKIMQNLYR